MATVRAMRFVIVALLLAAPLGGCTNPFTPAVPEKPSGTAVIENFNTPEALLTTLAAAIAARGVSGRLAYYDALADSTDATRFAFRAFHAPAAVEAWHVDTHLDPPTWVRRPYEELFYDHLAELYPSFTYNFVWSPDNLSSDPGPEVDGLVTLRRHYTLIATSTDGAIEKIIAIGYADLLMQKAGGRYYLYRWEDRIDPEFGARPTDPDNLSMGARRLESVSSTL